jgi:hypothetical protein
MGNLGSSDTLQPLSYSIIQTDKNAVNTRENNYYTFRVRLPASATWTNNFWFHFVMYWNTHDRYFQTGYPTFSAGNAVTIPVSDIDTNIYLHPVKSFFNKKITNSTYFDKTSINDNNIYLYNPTNTKHVYEESKYNSITQPFRYKINENISGASAGSTNLFSGRAVISKNEICPALVVQKNSGYYYDNPTNDLEIVIGKPTPESFVDEDYSSFNYYPEVPKNYNLIAKIILGYPNQKISVYKNNQSFDQDTSILYIEMVAKNAIRDSVSDETLSRYFTIPIYKFADLIRKDSFNKFFNILSQKLISSFARFDMTKVKKEDFFIDTSTRNYVALHNFMKMPADSLLTSTIEPFSIQFSQNATEAITNYALIPPSTIMAGFGSTELYISDKKLAADTEFEVYLEKYNNTTFKNVLNTGNSLERDYSFKIKFAKNTNEFVIKNLFINSSKYFLTDSDYQYRIDNNLSTVGYYKSSTLNSISDFAINGYVAVVPDIKPERFVDIDFKQNYPINSSRITETEFENNLLLQNSSITKNEIINAKSGFAITDSFYIVDSSKPNNLFETIPT